MRSHSSVCLWLVAGVLFLAPADARSQTTPSPDSPPPASPPQAPAGHDHEHMNMDMSTPAWHLMQDGVLFGLFNRQGGPRGDNAEFKTPNWWMGMWQRPIGRHQISFTTMFSLDRATVGERGYAEIFQAGETVDGRPLVDRQHPHDFFMQVSGSWRMPLGQKTGLTIAGGPSGEPALGPVAFMHLASAAENPIAPLGHHTFDSTHVSFGVVTTAVDRGLFTVEGSVFNGREPDENRWDFDFGPLDSVSGRVWFRPHDQWELQVSSGRLKDPETLDPGDVVRTTASASWLQKHEAGFTAVTAGWGMNRKDEDSHASVFAEATWRVRRTALYGRFEAHEPEIAVLLTGDIPTTPEATALHGTLVALTAGGVRDVLHIFGLDLGVGADLAAYRIPEALKTGGYGQPISFHVFLRLRPAGAGMQNMRMGQMMSPKPRTR